MRRRLSERWHLLLVALGAQLMPAPLRRLDRWVLTHWPLVWRTQIVWIACGSLLVCGCIVATTLLWPLPKANLWTMTELGALTGGGLVACFGAMTGWAVWQLRLPVGELRATRHGGLALLNVLCIVMLWLPLLTTRQSLIYRSAHTLPDAVVESDIALHKDHGFWQCRRGLSAEVEAQRLTLDASLARFGLQTNGTALPERLCGSEEQTLLIWDDDVEFPPTQSPEDPSDDRLIAGAQLLKKRVEAVAEAKRLWRYGSRGVGSDWLTDVLTALFLAGMLGVLSYPRYAWRRRVLLPWTHCSPFATDLPSPRWLRTLDTYLLLNAPAVWVAGLHAVWIYSIVLGVLALPELWGRGFGPDDHPLVGLLVTGAAWALPARRRQHFLRPVSVAECRWMTLSFLLATAPWSVFALLRAVSSTKVTTGALFLGIIAPLVASIGLISAYQGNLRALLGVVLGVAWPIGLLIVLDDAGPIPSLGERDLLLLTFALSCVAHLFGRWRSKRIAVSGPGRIAMSVAIGSVPVLLLVGTVEVCDIGQVPHGGRATLAVLLFVYFAYVWVTPPLLAVLARSSYQPKER